MSFVKDASFARFISDMNGQADLDVDYKRKYKNLKRKLKFLVYVSTVNLRVDVRFEHTYLINLQVHTPTYYILILCINLECLFSRNKNAFRRN